jgi:NAD(P)-dependent dehydrogenase (short-subunit alcohol dehydrogenase family)
MGQRVVLMTGISSGIGEVTAKRLAQMGFAVFGSHRSISSGIDAHGMNVFPMDVCSDDSVRRGIDFVIEKAGRIDVLINNAGYALDGALEEASLKEAKAQFETNFFGVARVIKAVLPTLRSQRSGHIVNVSSVVGLFSVPFWGFYSASKFALEGYTEALHYELKPFGIRVSLVEPGFTHTDLLHHGHHVQNDIDAYASRKKRGLGAIAKYIEQAPSPAGVADCIARVVTNGSNKLRYKVGKDAKLITRLRRFLPQTLFETIVYRHFELQP